MTGLTRADDRRLMRVVGESPSKEARQQQRRNERGRRRHRHGHGPARAILDNHPARAPAARDRTCARYADQTDVQLVVAGSIGLDCYNVAKPGTLPMIDSAGHLAGCELYTLSTMLT